MSSAGDVIFPDLMAMTRGNPAGDNFYVATLMFQRAQQLRAGARPRVDARGHSTVKVAVLEVLAGLVTASFEAAKP